ncbi:MAG: EVE domain-containing protein [Myxococcales bacterium]|nr:EVE domain-containing protein [Myxococcales bacterium]
MARAQHWLLKSEPFKYSWSQLMTDGKTHWDGVRNYEARNNLRAMTVGDLCLFYHSNEGKEIVGVAEVVRAAYPDPSSKDDWSCVDVSPVVPFTAPVSLDAIRNRKALAAMQMLTRNRLSVTRVTAAEFRTLLKMGETALP